MITRTDIASLKIVEPDPKPKDQPTPEEVFQAQREELRKYINEYCIARVPAGSQELPHKDGGFYRWQFYLRAAMLKPDYLGFVGRCFWSLYKSRYDKKPFQIAGVEAGATPIIVAIVSMAPAFGVKLNAFTIRKTAKEYGLRNMLEGLPNDAPVVLIDDITSPPVDARGQPAGHATSWHAVNTLLQHRLPLYGSAFAVVFKGRKDAMRALPTSRGWVRIESIYTVEDFTLVE